MGVSDLDPGARDRRPWNAGNMVGAKRPLKPRDVWAIRFFLDEHRRLRDRALFDLAIDSKLRGCDLVKMKIGDIVTSGAIRNRATVIQQKTKRPVQFELMTEARAIAAKITAGSATAIGMTKTLLNKSSNSTLDQMLEYEGYAQTVAYLTPEYEEGVQAFREKRAPDFAGAAARVASRG